MRALGMRQINRALDRLVRPQIEVFHHSWNAFHLCGLTGLALAVVVTQSLARNQGLSSFVMTALSLVAVMTFLALVMTMKIGTGEEQIIYYHHEIAVMVATAAAVWWWRQPVLPFLDLMILGIGLFLACGRVGCFMVGCCHGRPGRLGVCYRPEHGAAGFPPYYLGVRLFPIQLVESLWVLAIVIAGISFVLRGCPPGTALTWYVITYDVGRFALEFARGDVERPYHRGFSEAQWISLVLTCAVPAAGLAGLLPFQAWHVGAAAALVLAMLSVAMQRRRRSTPTHRLLHPRHVKEIAEAVDAVSRAATAPARRYRWRVARPAAAISVRCTSLGIQVSASALTRVAKDADHYALSHRDGGLTDEAARILGRIILQLRHAIGGGEIVRGDHDVFHVLIHPAAAERAAR